MRIAVIGSGIAGNAAAWGLSKHRPQNLMSPSYLRMLRDASRFNTQCVADHAAGRLAGLTLGDYLPPANLRRGC